MQFDFLSEEPPVSPSVSQAAGLDWMTRVATYPLSIFHWLYDLGSTGSFSRMSPVFFQAMTAKTSQPSLAQPLDTITAPPQKDGRTAALQKESQEDSESHGEYLTLSISECHSAAAVCSLSDILETGDLPLRYFLSAKACAGLLRRSGQRGKDLPSPLKETLEAIANK